MLVLKDVIKEYGSGDTKVTALKGVSLEFRKSEFVSILGPSGCGKTTLLNIVGGLDKYTSGDLVINGTSTKEYGDRDWDAYRNHSVGFVFQSYNLIPHQNVLQNVEIALTLSGVSKTERKTRAIEALKAVGLQDQIYKKPNQMSGGQMQRVAIARALVNNPDIILADEPTGALDTETSVQVMDILREVAKERLVVMVTHNPEIAENYSTRIIRMLDGKIIDDSMPYSIEEENSERKEEPTQKKKKKEKKPTMSFWTALRLSLKNLFTKKGRTTLTSFAGSIGIIGIALILAVSQGTTGYINHVQESTLASYPLTIEQTTIDLTSLVQSFLNVGNEENKHELDAVYKETVINQLVNSLRNVEKNVNDLKSFKTYLETEVNKEGSTLSKAITGIQYSYGINPIIYTENIDGEIIKSDTEKIMTEMIAKFMSGSVGDNSGSNTSGMSGLMSMPMTMTLWQELLPATDGTPINDILKEQYDVVYGSWPNEYDEIVLVIDENNELDDLTLYALGLISDEEIDKIVDSALNGEELEYDGKSWSYKEICEREYKTILTADCYERIGDVYVDKTQDERSLSVLYQRSLSLKVTGIIRPNEETSSPMLSGAIGYTNKLTEYLIEKAIGSDAVKAQKENQGIDIFTGLPFKSTTGTLTNEQKETEFRNYIEELSNLKKKDVYLKIKSIATQEWLMQQMITEIVGLIDRATKVEYLKTELSGVMNETQLNAMADTQLNQMFMGVFMQKVQSGEIPAENTISALLSMVDRQAKFDYLLPQLMAMTGMQESDLTLYLQNMEDGGVNELIMGLLAMNLQDKYAKQAEQEFNASYGIYDGENLIGYDYDKIATDLDAEMQNYTQEQCANYYDNVTEFSNSSYEENLVKLGVADISSPQTISIYASTFDSKEIIENEIKNYNKGVEKTSQIRYTDYVGLMMSSVTDIIDAISYVLISFVSISLIVSSIMIGVITLISVQERTKEIGILRAIGASKKDVSSMFNAETLIIGFTSGLIGVLVTYLLCIPINLILRALTGLATLKAVLPVGAAIILVLISMTLTLISGIIPSRSAAKKDPVVALRTE